MKLICTTLLTAVISLALAFGGSSAVAVPKTSRSYAAAPLSVGPTPRPKQDDIRNLSASQKRDVELGDRLRRHSTHTNTLNYKDADRYDRGRATYRRQFAAGWLYAGGHISHISGAELKEVRKYEPARRLSGHPTCSGVNLSVVTSRSDFRVYVNSCTTAKPRSTDGPGVNG